MSSEEATVAQRQSMEYISAVADRARLMTVQQLQKSWGYYRMLSANRVVKIRNVWEQPLYITPPTSGRWIDRDDLLPDAVSTEPAAMAFWKNKYLAIPIAMNMLEMWQKEGDPTQLWDLLDLRSMEAAWAKGRMMASAFFNGASGRQPEGLSYAIQKAAKSAQNAVIGGLSQATFPWWRTNYVELTSNFGAIPADSTIFAGFLAALALKDACTIGTQVPTDLMTRKEIFALFKRGMMESSTAYHLISDKVAVAEFGFDNLKFDGAYLGWDPNCPADSIYALHMGQNQQMAKNGDPRDPAKLDRDLEEAPMASKFIETEGGIWMSIHPNIRSRRLAPRSPYRQLAQTEWLIDSWNLLYARPSDNGVAGSNNSSRWSTWA